MTSMLGLVQATLLSLAVQTAPQTGAHPPAERPQAASPARSARPSEGWTWTLYSGDGPLVLANEIPDTPQLKAILECQPGSGIARLDLFGTAHAGVAIIASGRSTASV